MIITSQIWETIETRHVPIRENDRVFRVLFQSLCIFRDSSLELTVAKCRVATLLKHIARGAHHRVIAAPSEFQPSVGSVRPLSFAIPIKAHLSFLTLFSVFWCWQLRHCDNLRFYEFIHGRLVLTESLHWILRQSSQSF